MRILPELDSREKKHRNLAVVKGERRTIRAPARGAATRAMERVSILFSFLGALVSNEKRREKEVTILNALADADLFSSREGGKAWRGWTATASFFQLGLADMIEKSPR